MTFQDPVDRRGTHAFKWDRYRDQDILPMWVADMDFTSPPAVMEALHQRVDHGVFGYTGAPPELTEVLIERMARLYNWNIDPEWLVWLPGLVCGLNVTTRAVGAPGDAVLTTAPIYPPFLSAPKNQDRDLITVPMHNINGRWELDFDELEAAITDRTQLFILCNPHNPLGRVFTRQELTRLAALCEKHDIVICSDEIHCDLILDGDKTHIPTASLTPEIADRTITLMAPSKTFNLPGLGLSFAVIPNAKLRAAFKKTMVGIVPHPNLFGYTAALAAYQHGQEWLDDLRQYLRVNRDRVFEAVGGMPRLHTAHVEATYLAWIDARELDTDNPYDFFETAGVGLSDGKDFAGDGFVRLNFGCHRNLLETALERMRQAVLKL